MKVTATGVLVTLLVVLLLAGACVIGVSYGAMWMKQAQPVRIVPVIVLVTSPIPAPTESVLPTASPTVLPTVTSSLTPTPVVVYAPSLDCSDPKVIKYLDNNEDAFGNFDSIVKRALSHFNTSKGGKQWIDYTELDDADQKIGDILNLVKGLKAPPALANFHFYQVKYLENLKKAFKLGQDPNKSSQDEAWEALGKALGYQYHMNVEANAVYTCGVPLRPSQ